MYEEYAMSNELDRGAWVSVCLYKSEDECDDVQIEAIAPICGVVYSIYPIINTHLHAIGGCLNLAVFLIIPYANGYSISYTCRRSVIRLYCRLDKCL